VWDIGVFYGQLQHIYEVPIASAKDIGLPREHVAVLAVIERCNITSIHPRDGIDVRYCKMNHSGRRDVVDMAAVRCLVGRIPSTHREWAVVDRNGDLARSSFQLE
jgi:hypothetical protein